MAAVITDPIFTLTPPTPRSLPAAQLRHLILPSGLVGLQLVSSDFAGGDGFAACWHVVHSLRFPSKTVCDDHVLMVMVTMMMHVEQ